MDYFETEFCNKRDTVVHVQENGRVLLVLEPGESKFVETNTPKTSYARWSKITFKAQGEVKLDENREWQWPYPGLLMLTALNVDGVETEGIQVDGKYWECYRGIPRHIPTTISSPWAFIERVRFVQKTEKIKEGDYFKTVTKLVWLKELRGKKERRDIERQLVKLAMDKAREETVARFPNPEADEALSE
jgi:hypothetical protein